MSTVHSCDNCGVDTEYEPMTLCDECSGISEADGLQEELAVVQAHIAKLREVLLEHDRKLTEIWGKEENPHAVAYGWVKISWEAALKESE